MTDRDTDEGAGRAHYVFAVRFRVASADPAVSLSPDRFETTLRREAPSPGAEGWRFFEEHLWRGSLSAPDHFRDVVQEAMDVRVESVEFRELRTDEDYLSALRSAVADDLERFRADSVDRALTNYLGSSIHVVDRP